MFDPCPGAGDAPVARFVVLANRLSGLAFELDVGPSADLLAPALTGFVVIAPIRPEDAAAVVPIQHVHQVLGVGHAGVTHLGLQDQLVSPIHADRRLVAEVRLAMLLCPARLDILLPALGRRQFGWCRTGLDLGLLLDAVVLSRRPHDAGVDDLSFARVEAMQLKMALHFVENQVFDLGLHQALAEVPDCVAIQQRAEFFRPAKRWKLMRSRSWNSLCSSDRLNS